MHPSCLVVDDNATYANALRIQFERDGITVVGIASTITDALLRIGECGPDVALVDVRLRRESGIECAHRITGASFPRPPLVILMSAYRQPDAVWANAASFVFVPKTDLSVRAICEALAARRP